MKLKHLFIVAAAGLVAVACDKKTDETPAPITIEWEGRDINKRHELKSSEVLDPENLDPETGMPSSKVPVKINVNAVEGIKSFVVKIESDLLTKEVLEGVGLAEEFDLAAPPNDEIEAILKGLKFPTGADVVDKTELSMDITRFIPMIFFIAKDGKADFKVTITDNKGNTLSKTVQLDILITKSGE